MKKHTTTLIILLFAAAAYGQKVEFEYDKAGNRVLREYKGPPKIALNDPRHNQDDWDEYDQYGNDKKNTQNEEKEAKDKTVVFPNPTRGNVTVMLGSAYTEGELSTVTILDTNGKEMQRTASPESTIQVNLKGLRHGVGTQCIASLFRLPTKTCPIIGRWCC